jgi:hypothetical protein
MDLCISGTMFFGVSSFGLGESWAIPFLPDIPATRRRAENQSRTFRPCDESAENQKPDVVELTGIGFLVCHHRRAAPASGSFHPRVCESTKVMGGS